MQTFLPLPSPVKSLRVLDDKRLGKQRLETNQILKILLHETDSTAWQHHPAVLMWKGYENCLISYYNSSIRIWRARGFKSVKLSQRNFIPDEHILYPPWFGDEAFHSSHRAALLAKNFDHYSQFGWSEEPRIRYVWPVTHSSSGVSVA